MEQMTLFDMIYTPYKIQKPIRLIELFAGIGSQSKALENLKVNFEHWKICEWAIPSILAYKEIHQDYLPNYKVDYAQGKTKEELIDYLYNIGVSSNYNEPMTRDQVKRLSEDKLRDIYNAIKSENNLVNISTTKGEDLQIKDTDKFDYIMCYSFPCQDLSLAGQLKGMSRNTETRSGLLWQVERLLKECKELPQILLMENVPQVIGEKNIKDFQEWEYFLESLGYKNYVEVLNAKDYGIPQNRQRCFMVSILGDYVYNFPRKQKLELRLKDMLEESVNEKYYLSDKIVNFFEKNSLKNEEKGNGFRFTPIEKEKAEIAKTITTRSGGRMDDNFIKVVGKIEEWHQRGTIYDAEGVAPTLCSTDYKTPKLIQVGELDIKGNDSIRRVYDPKGLCPTITTMSGGNRQPKIVENEAKIILTTNNKSVKETNKPICLNSKGGRNGIEGMQPSLQDRVYSIEGVSTALTTSFLPSIAIPEATKKGYAEAHEGDGVYINRPHQKRGVVQNGMIQTLKTSPDVGVVVPPLRIRKLTPKECYRLMGFDDLDCKRASKVISDSMIYHTAGDSIVVNVLMAIFGQLM